MQERQHHLLVTRPVPAKFLDPAFLFSCPHDSSDSRHVACDCLKMEIQHPFSRNFWKQTGNGVFWEEISGVLVATGVGMKM